jgi:hypothetical protein
MLSFYGKLLLRLKTSKEILQDLDPKRLLGKFYKGRTFRIICLIFRTTKTLKLVPLLNLVKSTVIYVDLYRSIRTQAQI